MTTITVFKFCTPDGAEKMLGLVRQLTQAQLVTVKDAASVTWPYCEQKPRTQLLGDQIDTATLNGAFWGMLFARIFFVPFFGIAVGTAMGALSGKFSNYGIDERFIYSVSEKLVEGTSALFLMTSHAVKEKVVELVNEKGWEFELISTNLTEEQEANLRQDFGVD